jgi:DNA (cytosine-5)-methyltransferase 1
MSKLKVLDLFSGIGGFSLGLERTGGFETVAFCEIEEFPRKILNKHWPEVPCYHDIKELTSERLASDGIAVDVVCGGFPCQDISTAGRMAGIEASRSGLWREVIRLVRDIRPKIAVLENVTALLNGGLSVILGELAKIGYDAEWHCIRASRFGLPHIRDRVWIIAYARRTGWKRLVTDDCLSRAAKTPFSKFSDKDIGSWLQMVSRQCGLRNGDGLSLAVDRSRLKTLGNAVVPQIPELIGNAILSALPALHEVKI